MAKGKKRTEVDALESKPEVEAWAAELVAAVGKRQARKVLDDYQRLAADKQLSAFDRAVAKQRGRILAKLL